MIQDLESGNGDLLTNAQRDLKCCKNYVTNKWKLSQHYARLKMIIQFRLLTKKNEIKARLKMIDLQKQIFVVDLEQGNGIKIPKEVSVHQLPMSYRFYDPVVGIC